MGDGNRSSLRPIRARELRAHSAVRISNTLYTPFSLEECPSWPRSRAASAIMDDLVRLRTAPTATSRAFILPVRQTKLAFLAKDFFPDQASRRNLQTLGVGVEMLRKKREKVGPVCKPPYHHNSIQIEPYVEASLTWAMPMFSHKGTSNPNLWSPPFKSRNWIPWSTKALRNKFAGEWFM